MGAAVSFCPSKVTSTCIEWEVQAEGGAKRAETRNKLGTDGRLTSSGAARSVAASKDSAHSNLPAMTPPPPPPPSSLPVMAGESNEKAIRRTEANVDAAGAQGGQVDSPRLQLNQTIRTAHNGAASSVSDAIHIQTLLHGYQTRIKYLEQQKTLSQLQIKAYQCTVQDYQYKLQNLQVQHQKLQHEVLNTRRASTVNGSSDGVGAGGLRCSSSGRSVASSQSSTAFLQQQQRYQPPSSELQQWLFEEGTRTNKVQLWMAQYCQKLRDEYNIPVDRLFITNMSCHDPTHYFFGWQWERNASPRKPIQYTKRQFQDKLQSLPKQECFQLLYTKKKKCVNNHYRHRSSSSNNKHNASRRQSFLVPGTHWFDDEGEETQKDHRDHDNNKRQCQQQPTDSNDKQYTHCFSLPIHHREFLGSISWATKHPNGFTKQHLQFFQQSLSGLALVVRYQTNESNQETLLKRMDDTIQQRTQELASANTKLQHANYRIQQQAQAQLRHFAMMSHEIRTPLNCIIGLSSLLVQDDSGLNDEQHEALKMISGSGDLLLHVVDDVLNYSKLAVGQVTFHMERTSLEDTLGTVFCAIVQQRHQKQQIRNGPVQLRVHTPKPLPRHIFTDGRRLQQVLYNLLGNAFKFGRDGKYVDCTVTTELEMPSTDDHLPTGNHGSGAALDSTRRDHARMLKIAVKDYGVGIHPDQMKNIFQPFKQGSVHTEREYGGTGLGLAITSNLVKAMGGRISVRSEHGKWCEFIVELPLILPADALDQASAERSAEVASSSPSSSSSSSLLPPTPDLPKRELSEQNHADFDHQSVDEFQFSSTFLQHVVAKHMRGRDGSSLPQEDAINLARFTPDTAVSSATVAPSDDTKKYASATPEGCGIDEKARQTNHKELLDGLDRVLHDDEVGTGGSAGMGVIGYEHLCTDALNGHPIPRSPNHDDHEYFMACLDSVGTQSRHDGGDGGGCDGNGDHGDEDEHRLHRHRQHRRHHGEQEQEQEQEQAQSWQHIVHDSPSGIKDDSDIPSAKTPCGSATRMGNAKEPHGSQLDAERTKQSVNDHFAAASTRPAAPAIITDSGGWCSRTSPTTQTSTAPSSLQNDWGKLRVLVAEDNKINQKVCKRILSKIGVLDIDIVDNGSLAVEHEKQRDYDIVLMDLEMPVMNGLCATKHIVSRRQKMSAVLPRVLFLSAHALDEYKQQAKEAGGDGFLSKPFRMEAIKDALSKLDFLCMGEEGGV